MAELRLVFARAGVDDVQTSGQSGNVVFDLPTNLPASELVDRLESGLLDAGCVGVRVLLRTDVELTALIRACPFPVVDVPPKHSFITLLAAQPPADLKRATPDGALEVVGTADRAVFWVARAPDAYGRFVESQLEQPVTTRNWNVLQTVARLANSE